jgi:CheY-like chemotaxis protein
VLKNLLANAFKFTERGGVTLTVRKADKGRRFASRALDEAASVIAFAVADTGIGIAREKQQLIFEAFQQADGTTSRKFGGTGLGLSISREIARLLGGEIRVESEPAKGSTFTLFLPARYVDHEPHREIIPGRPGRRDPWAGSERRRGARAPVDTGDGVGVRRSGGGRAETSAPVGSSGSTATELGIIAGNGGGTGVLEAEASLPATDEVATGVAVADLPRPIGFDDDRDVIEPGDRVVLIIENDANFAKVLLDMARDKGFRGLVGLEGEAGLELAHAFEPDAITLDIDMPGMDGWEVLDRLKHHPDTRHIPVHIITGINGRTEGLKAGAIAYIEKPATKEALDDSFARISTFIDEQVKHLLVVEDDETQRRSMVDLIAHEDVEITAVGSAEEALRALAERRYDCMVLDLGLRDMSGFELLERVKADPAIRELPIIVYTGKDLSSQEDTQLRRYAETIIIKDVKSPERLLDETALFLHRVESRLPEQKRRMLERLHTADATFAGKHVLIVDDDVRNIFSLTSVLEDHGMRVSFAENGRDAIKVLEEKKDVDLVLMDIMMPEMDGYETTRAIRELPELRALPIIALTAKAMKGDREKTIAAGASDYITKPVDTDQLLSLMRVWLYK